MGSKRWGVIILLGISSALPNAEAPVLHRLTVDLCYNLLYE
jgi:hypothetical protein